MNKCASLNAIKLKIGAKHNGKMPSCECNRTKRRLWQQLDGKMHNNPISNLCKCFNDVASDFNELNKTQAYCFPVFFFFTLSLLLLTKESGEKFTSRIKKKKIPWLVNKDTEWWLRHLQHFSQAKWKWKTETRNLAIECKSSCKVYVYHLTTMFK